MTRGNKERLEALSPEGKLFPLKAKERANLLLLVASEFPEVHRVSWQHNGVWLKKNGGKSTHLTTSISVHSLLLTIITMLCIRSPPFHF